MQNCRVFLWQLMYPDLSIFSTILIYARLELMFSLKRINFWLPSVYAGVSLKTQELYALVFATRYLDIFVSFYSVYNTLMKLIFLGSSFSIVWYIRHHRIVRRSYDKSQDTFRHHFLLLPCLLLALVINEKFTFREVSFTTILRCCSYPIRSMWPYCYIQ